LIGTLARAVQAVRDGLLSSVGNSRREQALVYVRVSDGEELTDAARRTAIIRERMHRQGLLR
jgi:hypothetical protein